MSLYANDGSINVSVVDGSSYTGLYAADGSFNVVKSSGSSYVGLYHPCGAYNVTVSPGTLVPRYAPDGSLYVNNSADGSSNTGMHVTVVSGSLGTSSNMVWGSSNLLWSTDHLTWS